MKVLYAIFQTLLLCVLCAVAFFVAMLVLPLMSAGGGDGLLMQVWNLGLANAAFYGLPYWHLTNLKSDGFLPRANSYVLIWLFAILTFAALPMSFLMEFEVSEFLYSIGQAIISSVALFYAHKFQATSALNSE